MYMYIYRRDSSEEVIKQIQASSEYVYYLILYTSYCITTTSIYMYLNTLVMYVLIYMYTHVQVYATRSRRLGTGAREA